MFVMVASLATIFVWRQALAANVLWSSPAGSAWLTTTNWTGGAVPTGTDVAQFGANPTGVGGAGINFNGATNAGPQINGQKIEEVGAVEVTSARAASLLIGNSSTTAGASGTFRLNGAVVNSVAHVIVRNNSGQLFTIQNTQGGGTQTTSVALNDAIDNIINIDGSGGITISTVVKNAGGNHITLGGIGSGTLTLSAANTYTGGTTINGAKAVATINSALGTGNVTVSTSGVGLTLQGASNNFIDNAATVTIASGAKMALNQTGGSDTVGTLILAGVTQTAGTYGSSASGATFVNDTFFTGTGTLTVPGGSTNPTGTGTASPGSVAPSQTTLLTVKVTPGTNPDGLAHTVVANLTAIGGSASQAFLDNGLNGDAHADDNIFSYTATVANGTSGGNKSLPFTITETNPGSRTGSGTIALFVLSSTDPSGAGTANPSSVLPGASTLLTVNVTPGTNPNSTGLAVTADLSSIGGSASQAFSGSGNTFTFTATVANATTPGLKSLPFTITDTQLRSGSGSISLTVLTPPPPNDVVISQVFGGGGNSGSVLRNDFIELINHSGSPVNLNGWSVQAFVTPTSGTPHWEMTTLPSFTLQPGQYFLIQEAAQGGGTEDLPLADAVGTIPVSSTTTRVALLNNATLITATCPSSGVIDLVGYGAAPCFETSPAPAEPDNVTAVLRRNQGCFDTDNNANDFVLGEPNPRNSSSPFHGCTGLSAYGSANPSTVLQGESSTLSVYVAPAQNPPSTGITVTADLSAIGGSPSQPFINSGNNIFTANATVPSNTTPGMKSFPVSVSDSQPRTATTNIVLSVLPLIADHVTISQVYGGGGNTGATKRNDFVQLHNPTGSPVDVGGWTIQYASAGGTSWQVQPLGGVIPPGGDYLVSLASGGAVGAPLPPANVLGSINISGTTGKIALSNSGDALLDCPLGDPTLVDLVGYGTADCHEGSGDAPAPSNTTAIFRKANGDTDSDRNNLDFMTGSPNPSTNTPIVEIGPYVLNVDPRKNSTGAPHDTSLTVTFTEPVDVTGTWFNINCASGLHNDATVANTSDFRTYVITPNVNFQFGEQCTATIFQGGVHDQDTDDATPGDDMLKADYVWSFTVVDAGQPAPYAPSVHLTMGNPSNATNTLGNFNNYLMEKPTYSLSYNRDKGTPNWVSWHLDSSWYGSLARVDSFRPDPAVDPSWYRVQAFDYSNSGFDRGHMTPNADRDNQNRVPINQETFLMSNMVPQSPDNNQGPWANLEAYLRTLGDANNELYIVAGPVGMGGSGSNGGTTNTVANGHVIVPAATWKVALVIPKDTGDDVSRVTCSTRTIAVLMPNIQGIRGNDWHMYLTTVDNIEQQTGYNLFSNLPPAVQACIEAGTDGANLPGTADQSAMTTEDNAANITLSALSPDSNATFTYTYTQPSHGAVTGTGPNVTYTPAADYNGSDSFTFFANDGHANSNTSTVSISISEVNDSPTAADDSKSTPEDNPLIFSATDLTANDSAGPANENTQALTVTAVAAGANTHGTVDLTSGAVTYSPAADYNGPASFTYTVCDDGTTNGSPDSKCTTATVNVDVQSVNDNPLAVDDSTTTDEDTPVIVNVLTNDSDVDGDNLSVSAVTQGAHGSVTNNGSNVTYSPAANFNGSDSFSYTVSDGNGGTATANVSVTINAVNDTPVANNDSAATDEDTPATISVLTNDSDVDGDSLTVSAVTQGAHGSVTNNGSNVTYSPAANYHGGDSFSYTVSDGHSGTATATVEVTINSVNDNPLAVADSATTNEDNPATIDVVLNDTDVDGDSLSLSSVGSAAHGSVSIVSGKAVYSPAANYNGNDSFGYVVSDGHGGQANGVVSVTVNPVNDAPTANGQSVNTASNAPVAITLTGSDVETPSGSLTFTVTSGPSHGSLSGAGANRTYTPGLNYSGPDSFKFTVTDTGDGSSAPLTSAEATVSITVNDTVGPVITLNGNSIEIWPPNKSMHTINVADLVANAVDNFDPNVNLNSVVIASVSSDEGTAASGDIVIAGNCKSVQLRATRNGNGDGRVYTITFSARDAAGNTSFVTAKVTVPHDQGHGAAIDSGAAYTINSSCP